MKNDVKIISALKGFMRGEKVREDALVFMCDVFAFHRTATLLRLPRIFPQRARDSLGAAPNPEVTFSLRFTLDSRGSEGKKGDVEKASSAEGVVAVTE